MTLRGRKKGDSIPKGVVTRLPVYFRYLSELEMSGIERVSSAQLGVALDFTAAQIRSDLSYFGSFGQQGYGYNVKELLEQVKQILGLGKDYSVILVGAGNLGKAIASYEPFRAEGFAIQAIFDIDPLLVGNFLAGVIIQPFEDLRNYLQKNRTDIVILATPKQVTEEIATLAMEEGVTAFWNFSPVQLNLPDHILVEHLHLTDSLLCLAFRLNEKEQTENIV